MHCPSQNCYRTLLIELSSYAFIYTNSGIVLYFNEKEGTYTFKTDLLQVRSIDQVLKSKYAKKLHFQIGRVNAA